MLFPIHLQWYHLFRLCQWSSFTSLVLDHSQVGSSCHRSFCGQHARSSFSFDRNKMWSHCPGRLSSFTCPYRFYLHLSVTCDGYPQQDANSVGFRLLIEQRPCVFRASIAQDTGQVLKYYTVPTCQLEPLCRDNYVPLFRQITCREDGRYSNPRAVCLPST